MADEIINVGGDFSIEEIQIVMTRHYPYLRFEFYKFGPFLNGVGGMKKISLTTMLKDLALNKDNISIEIKGDKKIAELKSDFEKFGLMIIPYRKSGNLWIKTTLTQDWSLSAQNEAGKILSI